MDNNSQFLIMNYELLSVGYVDFPVEASISFFPRFVKL